MAAALELRAIDKSFGAVHAVRGASLSVEAGRIHAVVGENGAGKSTLLRVAAGLLVPDAGEVRIEGAPLAPATAAEAIARGVGMVQQHFALVGVFTALENLILGGEPTRSLGRLDLVRGRAAAERVAGELGTPLPLDACVETLGVGDRQRIEIARLLLRDARTLILDEPTAVLTPGEAEALYKTLRRLAQKGRAVVVVTHKLDEVEGHADEVTVMRRGRVVHEGPIAGGAKRDEELAAIAAAIMGGEAPPPIVRARGELGRPLLSLKDVSLGRALAGVSLSVRAGEIVGIAGVEGNGQRELVRVLAGLESHASGSIGIETASGRALVVHEDRHAEGLVLDAPVADNLVLGELGRFARNGMLDTKALRSEAGRRASRFDVQPPDLDLSARALSGGNQQKIVVARAVARAAGEAVLVVAHPTRGVDLGAARTIHRHLLDAAKEGAAVLVVSADLAELRALSDRVLVMRRGRIVAELAPTATDAEIGAHMIGVRTSSAPPPAP